MSRAVKVAICAAIIFTAISIGLSLPIVIETDAGVFDHEIG